MTLCLEMPTLAGSSLDTQALLDLGAQCVQVARRDKMPIGMAWHERSTSSLAVIEQWLAGGWNVGILLGHGNLIDVEYDDDAGRQDGQLDGRWVDARLGRDRVLHLGLHVWGERGDVAVEQKG